jgi:hypothetical protein
MGEALFRINFGVFRVSPFVETIWWSSRFVSVLHSDFQALAFVRIKYPEGFLTNTWEKRS